MTNYLYEENVEKYKSFQSRVWLKDTLLRVEEVENGVVAPVDNPLLNFRYAVVRPDNTVVPISADYKMGCSEYLPNDYKVSVPENIPTEHKTIVYCGKIWIHYGHWLMEHCSRLWYALKNNDKNVYYAFGVRSGNISAFPTKWMVDFCALLGIDESQLLFINQPTRFDKIIVPEISAKLSEYYTPEYAYMFKHIAQQVPAASGHDKVYFSRMQFKGNNNTIGEENIEQCFRQSGFEIIYPETMDLKTQISIIKGCKVFAALNGSACHNLLFADGNVESYILNRFEVYNPAQLLVDEIAGKKTHYVDTYFGFLPVSHGGGPFLVNCNANLSKCLKENFGIDTNYNNLPDFSDGQIMEYITRWFNFYSVPNNLNGIPHFNVQDYLIKGRDFFNKMDKK